jgi:membrane protease YdiL (CAAX protease family)
MPPEVYNIRRLGGDTLTQQHSVTGNADAWPWLLLPMRLVLFALFQGLIALIVARSAADPWAASLMWWPFGIVITNVITVVMLIKLFASEGKSYFSLFRIDRTEFMSDLFPVLGLIVVMAILAIVPNMLLANLLLGSSEAPAEMFIKTLPFWAALFLLFVFPVSIALAEMPLYLGFIMPRLEKATGRRWLAITVPAFFAAAQHITMPLIFDWRFVTWRLLMFIPFSLFLAVVIRSRPRLLPYFVIVHGLLDVSLVVLMF